MLKDLVSKNRSYRRFDESVKIDTGTLKELVSLARLSASGSNKQPLKFILSNSAEMNEKIFENLVWAGYLKDWDGPEAGERPAGYIVVLGDTEIAGEYGIDPGIMMQSMLLGAVEKGLGGCMFSSIKREKLAENLKIPERYRILNVVALGKPVETVLVDDVKDGDIKYWRDSEARHHVPKRSLDELIIS